MRLSWVMALAVLLVGCASGGTGSGTHLDPDFDFSRTRSVYLARPVQVSVPGSARMGDRELERTLEEELRDFFRREQSWTWATRPDNADLVAKFELTRWEQKSDGSRVGGKIELARPDGESPVFKGETTYPSRFGTGAPGSPQDILHDFFRALFEPINDS